jgi:hypothetical protein
MKQRAGIDGKEVPGTPEDRQVSPRTELTEHALEMAARKPARLTRERPKSATAIMFSEEAD